MFGCKGKYFKQYLKIHEKNMKVLTDTLAKTLQKLHKYFFHILSIQNILSIFFRFEKKNNLSPFPFLKRC